MQEIVVYLKNSNSKCHRLVWVSVFWQGAARNGSATLRGKGRNTLTLGFAPGIYTSNHMTWIIVLLMVCCLNYTLLFCFIRKMRYCPFFPYCLFACFRELPRKKMKTALDCCHKKRKVEEHSVVGEILLARPMNLSCIFHLDSCYLCEHTFQFEQQVHSLLAPPRSTPHPPKSSWSWIKPLPSSFSVCWEIIWKNATVWEFSGNNYCGHNWRTRQLGLRFRLQPLRPGSQTRLLSRVQTPYWATHLYLARTVVLPSPRRRMGCQLRLRRWARHQINVHLGLGSLFLFLQRGPTLTGIASRTICCGKMKAWLHSNSCVKIARIFSDPFWSFLIRCSPPESHHCSSLRGKKHQTLMARFRWGKMKP